MNCLLCGKEMKKGGIIVSGRTIMALEWYPAIEFNKRGLKSWNRTDGKELLDEACLFGSKFEDAFYCEHCNKVIGLFNVRKESES
ncbi:PF20097 family protein [Emergencia sp.]|uniref:PF20097 family protein n=1 Tax=Emergencia sp. TaxID=1926557 RepID=UPI003AF12B04